MFTWRCFAGLLQSKGRHSAALDLLRTLSEQPEKLDVPPTGASVDLKGLPGVWAAVRCLCSMHQQDLQLITTHAR